MRTQTDLERVLAARGVNLDTCSDRELMYALTAAVRQLQKPMDHAPGQRKLYYFSAEFLVGRLLRANLINLGLLEDSAAESRWLKSAQSQITRLDSLIQNLVELARTEETVKEASAVRFSLSEVALASVDAFQPLAEAAGKSLSAEIAPGVEMRGVKDNLFRLFSILLDNAVKYCDPGGTIRLSLSLRGRTISLSVSNPCAGLDPGQLPRYFDRFYRADSSRARATGGYGIGLSTAKAIVARHHGRIANRYAGGVITFSVTLPQGLKKEDR